MILLYHNIVPPSAPPGYTYTSLALSASHFKRHIGWLVKYFQIVSLSEYLEHLQTHRLKKHLAITFDDGLAETFKCIYTVLKEYQVPATIFVTTCHLEHGDLLWGSYLNALCYETGYPEIQVDGTVLPLLAPEARRLARRKLSELARSSGDPVSYTRALSHKYPLEPGIRRYYQGMTYEQLKTAGRSPLIEIGSHTLTHPYLSDCSKEHQFQEIAVSKQLLAGLTGQPVRYLAYPFGDYDSQTLALVTAMGFETAFATISRNLDHDPIFEVERTGVYSASLLKLHIKAAGIANLGRRIGLMVG